MALPLIDQAVSVYQCIGVLLVLYVPFLVSLTHARIYEADSDAHTEYGETILDHGSQALET